MANHLGVGTFINDETELTTSGLDVFSVPPVDNTLEEGTTIYIYPINAIDSRGPFEFTIPRDPDSFIYLPMTRLEGTITVSKEDGTGLADTDAITVVNLFPQSIFKQVECEINGTQVCDLSTPTYAYKSYLETHLSYNHEAKRTHLHCSMYHKDTEGKEENVAATWDNVEGKKRFQAIAGNTPVHFSNIIHSDIFHCQRYLIPNTDLKLKFLRNEDEFSLLAAADKKAKINITNLRLAIRKIKINPAVKEAFERKLETHPAIYPLTQSKIKTFQIPLGTNSIDIPSILQGNLPRSIIIGLVGTKGFNGNISGNPYYFNHRNVNNFSIKINGVPVVPTPFQPDFSTNKCIREYRWFLDNCGVSHENETNSIGLTEFMSNSTFWCFDLTPDLCNSFHLHKTKQGNIDVSIGFSKSTVTTLHVLVYASFNSAIAIDHERNVKLIE